MKIIKNLIIYLLLIAATFTSCSKTLETIKPIVPMSFSTASRSSLPGTFEFDLPIIIKLDTIKDQIMQNLNDTTISNINIKLKEVKVYGADNSDLVIGLNVDAVNPKSFLKLVKIKGWIYLKGTPDLNIEDQTFSIKNLSVDVQSQQVLLNTAAWLVKPLITAISNNIKIDIGDIVDEKKKMFENFEIPGYGRINLNIEDLQITEIDITSDELETRVKTSGTLSVVIDMTK